MRAVNWNTNMQPWLSNRSLGCAIKFENYFSSNASVPLVTYITASPSSTLAFTK